MTTPAIRCRPGAFGRLMVGRRWSGDQVGYNIERPPGVCRAGMLIACQPDRVTSSLLEPSRSCKKNKRAGRILGYICAYRFTNAIPYVYSSHRKCCCRKKQSKGTATEASVQWLRRGSTKPTLPTEARFAHTTHKVQRCSAN